MLRKQRVSVAKPATGVSVSSFQSNRRVGVLSKGLIAAMMALVSPLVMAVPFNYANNTVGAINDNACFTRSFNVSDNFTVDDLNVEIQIDHTFRGDLDITLTAPSTTAIDLTSDNGGGNNNLRVLFDDAAGTNITADNGPHNGGVVNRAPEVALSAFNGENAQGTWSLEICDDATQDQGTFNSAELQFDGTPVVLSGADLSLTKTASSLSADIGDTLTFTLTVSNAGPDPAPNVEITDILPTGFSYVGSSISGGDSNDDSSAPTLTWDITSLASGANAVLTYQAQIVVGGSYTNRAQVTASGETDPDSVPNNDDGDQSEDDEDSVSIAITGQEPEDVFYLPLPEDQLFATLTSLYPGDNTDPGNDGIDVCGNNGDGGVQNPVEMYASIAVLRDNTIIYYDHQEDGFEGTLHQPTQPSTEVWGDSDFSNGAPPGCGSAACDVLSAGSVIILDNQITTTGPDVVDFDGGDKVGASNTISMTKANWASGTSTLLAGALEMYPTSQWGTTYEIPVGENITTDINSMYQYTGIVIMAQVGGASVTIDLDGDPGTVGDITNVNLAQGQSHHVDGGILVGATVTSNNPVQVDVLTGDVCDNYESRFFTLFPISDNDSDNGWDNSYYNPVGTPTGAPTEVLLYNPNNASLTVLVEETSGATSTVVVPAGGTNTYNQTNLSGARLCTTTNGTSCNDNGEPFYAIASIDADASTNTSGGGVGRNHDWGFTLVPADSLTQQALIGLGLGNDPLVASTQNSGVVWVTTDLLQNLTPVDGNITLCVDYDNDGTDSGPPLVHTPTGLEYDIQIDLNPLQSTRLTDPDGDQTGMFLWVCDDDDDDQEAAVIAVAWGQDPNVASNGSPAIDVGTGIPNISSLDVVKGVEVSNDVNGDNLPNIGDILTYSVNLTNTGFVPLSTLTIEDVLPVFVSYVPNTTFVNPNDGGASQQIADANSGTPFPLDEGGVASPFIVNIGETITVTFQTTVTSVPDPGVICNDASGTVGLEVDIGQSCLPPSPNTASLGDFIWEDLDSDGIQGGGEPGIEGVTVTLLDNMGNPVQDGNGNVITTTTDANGAYLFTQLPAGDYAVRFDSSTAVAGTPYVLSAANQGGDDALDSDALTTGNTAVGETAVFALAAGEDKTDVDAAFIRTVGNITGSVLNDSNSSGGIDGGDAGIPGVTIQLWTDTNNDGVPDAFVSDTTTDANGDYAFTDVPVGSYVVVEVQPAGFVSVTDEDTSNDGDVVVNSSTTDNRIPVTLTGSETDADNIFLESVNATEAINDDNNTLVNMPVTGNLLFNDFDPQNQDNNGSNDQTQTLTGFVVDTDGDGTPDSATNAPGASVQVAGVDEDGNAVLDAGTLTVDAAGAYTYTPANGFTGIVVAEYTVCDNGTPQACDTAQLEISVTPYPDPVEPTINSVIANDDDNVSYGDPVSDNVVPNDSDPDGDDLDFQTFQNQNGSGTAITSGSTLAGTDTNGNAVANAGSLTFDGNGNYTFTPTAGFYGTVEVPYSLCDDVVAPNTACTIAILTIDVIPETDEMLVPASNQNDPPFAGDDHSITPMNTPVSGNWVGNDYDPNDDDITITVQNFDSSGSATTSGSIDPDAPAGGAIATITTQQGGTLQFSADGSYLYTPPTDYIGPDQATYFICDVTVVEPQPLCDNATVYLVVTPVMDFGDLPVTNLPGTATPSQYDTVDQAAARHYIFPTLRIGAMVDGETNGQPDASANGEGTDDDGTGFDPIEPDRTESYRLAVNVTNTHPSNAAMLAGWIDLNCNGLFETSERAESATGDTRGQEIAANSGTAWYVLVWDAPNNDPLITQATADTCPTLSGDSTTYVRIRLTSDRGTANGGIALSDFFSFTSPVANGPAIDGEIEDYRLPITSNLTPAVISDLSVISNESGTAVVSWTTASEFQVSAYKVERWVENLSAQNGGNWVSINEQEWVPSALASQGAVYQLNDQGIDLGSNNTYRVTERSVTGLEQVHGPFAVTTDATSVLQADILAMDGQSFATSMKLDEERIVKRLDTIDKYRSWEQDRVSRLTASGGSDHTKQVAASVDTLNLHIRQSGIYFVSAADLAAGFNMTESDVDSLLKQQKLGLSQLGDDIAWAYTSNGLLFYAEHQETPWLATTVYQLEVNTSGTGMDTGSVDSAAPSGSIFRARVDMEQDLLDDLGVGHDPEGDNWYWATMLNYYPPFKTREFELSVPNALANDGVLTIRLQGRSEAQHKLAVTVNGATLDTASFTGLSAYEKRVNIPADFFNGQDKLKVELTNNSTGQSQVHLDGFSVDYDRHHLATGNALSFDQAEAGPVQVKRLGGTSSMTVLDITDSKQPVLLSGGSQVSNGDYLAHFEAGRYAVATKSGWKTPVLEAVSGKPDVAKNTEYLVITARELAASAQQLADFRAQEFITSVVTAESIYDHAGHGVPNPASIRSFINGLPTTPKYVVLIGDGSHDYQDRYATGYNLLSPMLVDSGKDGLIPADTLLGDLDQDGFPDVAVGRIPAKNPSEVTSYVDKLIAFESNAGLPSLLLADNPDSAGNFTFSSNYIGSQSSQVANKLHLENAELENVRSSLKSEMRQGLKVINYVGHGGFDRLASEGLLTNTDITTLDNAVSPVLVGLTCNINNFLLPGFDSFGERLLLTNQHGAVASFAAVSMSQNNQAQMLGASFQQVMPQVSRLGDVMLGTLSQQPSQAPRYSLLGDPATRLR